MGWSTKGALRGDLHGFQVYRHHPHHSLSICSFREHDLGGFQHFLRIYGMEGGAPEEGEARTRIKDQVTVGMRIRQPDDETHRNPIRVD